MTRLSHMHGAIWQRNNKPLALVMVTGWLFALQVPQCTSVSRGIRCCYKLQCSHAKVKWNDWSTCCADSRTLVSQTCDSSRPLPAHHSPRSWFWAQWLNSAHTDLNNNNIKSVLSLPAHGEMYKHRLKLHAYTLLKLRPNVTKTSNKSNTL